MANKLKTISRRSLCVLAAAAPVASPLKGAEATPRMARDAHWIDAADYIPAEGWSAIRRGSSAQKVDVFLQRAIDDAIASRRSLILPGTLGEYRLTRPLIVRGPLNLQGDGPALTRLLCMGCAGIIIADGVKDVRIGGLTIARDVRASDRSNSDVGIRIAGREGSSCETVATDDVLIDGFDTAIEAHFASNCHWAGRAVFVRIGITVIGRSINNAIGAGSSFSGTDDIRRHPPIGNSCGIVLGDGSLPQPEGLTVEAGVVVFGFETGVRNEGGINLDIQGARFDAISKYGVVQRSAGRAAAMNCSYSNIYVGAAGANVVAAIWLGSAADHDQHRGTLISDLEVAIYEGSALAHAILIDGSAERDVTVRGLRRVGRTSGPACDVRSGSGHLMAGNRWGPSGFATQRPARYVANDGPIVAGNALLIY